MLPMELCDLFETIIRDSWYSGVLRGWLSDLRFIKSLVLGFEVCEPYGLLGGSRNPSWGSWHCCITWADFSLGLRSWLLLDFELWLLNPSPWLVLVGLRQTCIHIPPHIVTSLNWSMSLHPLTPLIQVSLIHFGSSHVMIIRLHYHSFIQVIYFHLLVVDWGIWSGWILLVHGSTWAFIFLTKKVHFIHGIIHIHCIKKDYKITSSFCISWLFGKSVDQSQLIMPSSFKSYILVQRSIPYNPWSIMHLWSIIQLWSIIHLWSMTYL